MMTAMASSTRLPRMMNSLKPFNCIPPVPCLVEGWEAARSLGIQARVALWWGPNSHSMQIVRGEASVLGAKRRLKVNSGQSDDVAGAGSGFWGQG